MCIRDSATAIDDAFARWDRAHLHRFWLADGRRVGQPDPDEEFDDDMLDERRRTLGRLQPGEQFVYEFDFGDSWPHVGTTCGSSTRSTGSSPPSSARPTGANQ